MNDIANLFATIAIQFPPYPVLILMPSGVPGMAIYRMGCMNFEGPSRFTESMIFNVRAIHKTIAQCSVLMVGNIFMDNPSRQMTHSMLAWVWWQQKRAKP